ncbi:MAG: SGNH/GDSL hydrolase family protein [Puia sp.]|nr:SGNH/GDSL hydrolase family protein [Puia sp.]
MRFILFLIALPTITNRPLSADRTASSATSASFALSASSASFTRSASSAPPRLHFFPANDPRFQYTGRIDFSDPAQPRFWAPGVYLKARFDGPSCKILLEDEGLNDSTHNYIAIVVDKQPPRRIKLIQKEDTLEIAQTTGFFPDKKTAAGIHTLTICKDTESGIGWLLFHGLLCDKLLPPPPRPTRRIEFIGNSITCGTGMDLSVFPCNQGQWYDQHNAYMSYGPVTSRSLNAEWVLTAVSGIGLIHSCCKMDITMPQVFDKMNGRANTVSWDFSRYQPDVVAVTLGQNDGIRDSTVFTHAYLDFIHQIRDHYRSAQIVCLTSPMGGESLTAALKNYIGGIVASCRNAGDTAVSTFFYSKQYHTGCGGHPDLAEHQEIAAELSAYIKRLMNW